MVMPPDWSARVGVLAAVAVPSPAIASRGRGGSRPRGGIAQRPSAARLVSPGRLRPEPLDREYGCAKLTGPPWVGRRRPLSSMHPRCHRLPPC